MKAESRQRTGRRLPVSPAPADATSRRLPCCPPFAWRRSRLPTTLGLALVLVLLAAAPAQQRPASSVDVKAGLLFNFLLFVDWPEPGPAADDEPILIGILGEDEFGDAFKPVEDKIIDGRPVVIRHFPAFTPDAPWRQCREIYIGETFDATPAAVLADLEGAPVLTVSGIEGFAESGGMIQLREENGHVRFDVNPQAARRAGLEIRSKVLRLALRIVDNETDAGAE